MQLIRAIHYITTSGWYLFLVMFVIMPIAGIIIERGEMWTGIILILMQMPWLIICVIPNIQHNQ